MTIPKDTYQEILAKEALEKIRFEVWWKDGRILHPEDRTGLGYQRDKEIAWRAWYASKNYLPQFEKTITPAPNNPPHHVEKR